MANFVVVVVYQKINTTFIKITTTERIFHFSEGKQHDSSTSVKRVNGYISCSDSFPPHTKSSSRTAATRAAARTWFSPAVASQPTPQAED